MARCKVSKVNRTFLKRFVVDSSLRRLGMTRVIEGPHKFTYLLP